MTNASQLHNKTVRPGSLNGYSYYYSNRLPKSQAQAPKKAARPSHRKLYGFLLVLLIIAVPLASYAFHARNQSPQSMASVTNKPATETPKSSAKNAPAVAATQAAANHCTGNTLDKFIKISISSRHFWACEGSKSVYDSVVITGMEMHPSTLTPPGTYQVYGKQTDQKLTGSDEAGTWDRDVSYWMPFLSNQYGIYGFHDATWRDNSEFGNVDPNSTDASHGCIELPMAAMAWVYSWAPVGTTLTIES